jgi:hypothetical protein
LKKRRLAANRANAARSTGPVAARGKAAVSRNALRHGVLSRRVLLDDQDPEEFDALMAGLLASLRPQGAVEEALAERVAIAIWRQQRLMRAETAAIALARQPEPIAAAVSAELRRPLGDQVTPEDLAPFDSDRAEWCRAVLAEIEGLATLKLERLGTDAPLLAEQLQADADDAEMAIPAFLAETEQGLQGFVASLALWCREQLQAADARPTILALAEQVRAKRLLMPTDNLDVLSRYQTTLDNQLYKALRAFRQAQTWRLDAIEAVPTAVADVENEDDVALRPPGFVSQKSARNSPAADELAS